MENKRNQDSKHLSDSVREILSKVYVSLNREFMMEYQSNDDDECKRQAEAALEKIIVSSFFDKLAQYEEKIKSLYNLFKGIATESAHKFDKNLLAGKLKKNFPDYCSVVN